jgi:hypothetical protein
LKRPAAASPAATVDPKRPASTAASSSSAAILKDENLDGESAEADPDPIAIASPEPLLEPMPSCPMPEMSIFEAAGLNL